MDDYIKKHALSFLLTFVAVFLTTFGGQLLFHVQDTITLDLIAGLILAAVRTALKIALETLVVK